MSAASIGGRVSEVRRPQEYELAAVFMVVGAMTDILFSMLLFFIGLFMCVGVLWLIPGMVAFVVLISAGRMVTGVRSPNGWLMAGVAIFNSILAFNPIGIACHSIALVFLHHEKVRLWLESGPPEGEW